MKKKVIIVGAGISGLSAGCYARMNNFETSIFEMHNIPGGLCTAWKRKGYTFDISMHMLTGSVSGPFHEMWKELGVIDKFKFHFHQQISRIESLNKQLTFTTNRESLLKEMLAIAPEDEKLIKEFIRLIFGYDLMNGASLKPGELRKFSDKFKTMMAILPLMGTFMKYGNVTLQQFAAKFKNPFLGKAMQYFIDSPGWRMLDFPMVALSGFMKSGISEAGVPLSGSMKVILHIAGLFKSLGGEINYNSRVKNLIIENNRVTGIQLENGQEHKADYVIWAADGHTLIFDILQEKYVDKRINEMYSKWIPVKPMVQVMMGVNRDFSDEPHALILETENPITITGQEFKWISLLHHCFDKSMAPEGKSVVEVWYDTEYDYWEKLSQDRENYEAEKKRIAEYTLDVLDKRWPGFKSKVEVVDVPTPATYKRYTGNWKASPDGWYITPANMRSQDPLHTLPGLDGLYVSGQWTAPFTGTVIAALTGRQTIELMCHKEGQKFVTAVAES